ncbi:hypothetical protein [Xanthomonas graminis]|uniref:hypothetical protein n=1 Tax=Xanthomonas graminis TaxID=3390026 RepID=UPI0011153E3F|nr:hypothetical protein [Xanthomonas translucens]WIH09641.1 hypothetical protein KM579_06130 [Xanthomonas translucens pv. graminis]WIH11626.1 hypothetical protein KM563_15830 [Xanthomonas translucens pv. graminis]
MKLGKSSDTSGRSKVYEISNELELIFPGLEEKYGHVDLEIFFVFRCLPGPLRRKAMRRYSKSENVLYIDFFFSEEDFSIISKDEQRDRISGDFFSYLRNSLAMYKFKNLSVAQFMCDLCKACEDIGWREGC